ncbi:MAG: hypothetical protein J0J01_07450 [Reyranella sp.]|uniref:hypothetical protein n=1 Tax=Reyranella sp. TaxID=1929291 RepID=UPI001ACC0800|nr:hypothetical protein [Reyranella sp.]MBN9086726.1 hypothetical protein [Reyranella sp.]
MSTLTSRRAILGWSLATALAGATTFARAASPLKMDFVTHATFFSGEMKLPKVLDPHVFVRDSAAPEGVGPQGIKHVAGVRPPFIDQDTPTSALFTAENKPLGFDLKTWLAAKGVVTISEQTGKVRLDASFTGLKPGGTYSLFENHFDQKPVGFTPMDGTGQSNSFVAQPDGSARVSLMPPHVPTHANAVLLVYHSDSQAHGVERGRIGVDAHHQLIARPE